MAGNSKSKKAAVTPRTLFERELVEIRGRDNPIPQWRYKESNEAEFVFSLALHAFSISSIDDFIECRQGVDVSPEIADELCELRADAFQAYMGRNFELMLAHARALTWACRFYGFRSVVLPDARRGRKVGRSAPKGGEATAEARVVKEDDTLAAFETVIERLKAEGGDLPLQKTIIHEVLKELTSTHLLEKPPNEKTVRNHIPGLMNKARERWYAN